MSGGWPCGVRGRGWRLRRPVRPILGLSAAALLLFAAPAVGQERELSPGERERLLEKLRVSSPAGRAGADSSVVEVPAESAAVTPPRRDGPARAAAGAVSAMARPGGRGMDAERDSVMAALATLPGYIATEYWGSGAHFVSDSGRVELPGKAQIVRAGQAMSADSALVYDLEREIVCGYGKPVLSGESAPVESEQVCYDVGRDVGVALGARTRFSQGANWVVHGERVYTAGSDRIYGRHSEFTSCELDVPHYHFAARRMKLVNDNVLVARDVTLNFADVPVFWLPFMVQSLKQGRRSGLLAPRFGINDVARTSSGYRRRVSDVGFFWAINDYMGAQLALDWFSQNWTALNGNFQYRWVRQFLDGGIDFRRFWEANGRRNLTLSSHHSWQPGERTSVRVNANYTTSSEFVRRNTFDPRELNRSIDSNAGLSHRFDWGSLSLDASRRQFLTTGQVELVLPSVGLVLSPLTLFRAPGAQASWYRNATWTGSANLRMNRVDVADTISSPTVRDRSAFEAGIGSGISLGALSWNQRFDLAQDVRQAKPGVDTLGKETDRRLSWSSSVNYQQRLFGTSTLTPAIQLGGQWRESPKTAGQLLAGPTRLDVSASLKTDFFGFWPGVGPYSRIRHRLSPIITYRYSPAVAADSVRRDVFGVAEIREQNRLEIGLSQTIEAKQAVKQEEGGAAPDTTREAALDTASGPRRLPQSGRVTLLSLSTSAVVYDFVQAREEGEGLVTTTLNNTVTSDLLRGLSLSFTHDLFRTTGSAPPGQPTPREFAPHLSNMNASFSLSSDSWLFRLLGLGRRRTPAEVKDSARAAPPPGETRLDPEREEELSLIGRRGTPAPARSAFLGSGGGGWNASLNYSLVRPRRDASFAGRAESQLLSGNVSFQPTPKWSVRWSTAYSFTDSRFSDHILTLTRDLHDWQANFDFVKAQNGNFSFQFRVHLLANPDIKLDYEQRGESLRTP
ncbi:MAG: LPS-assembly protein LptD [Gemmatimonadetes bacterium]|nr:LPS-assembly protein LptD [Gemmatimonadota bacterium]